MTRETGYIKTFKQLKNYGFIGRGKDRQDVFFHIKDWCASANPQEGERVSFLIGFDNRSQREKALDVRVADDRVRRP